MGSLLYLLEIDTMKHLTVDEAFNSLTKGIAIEQWIKDYAELNYVVIEWLRVDKEKDNSYSVAFFRCFDEGEEDFFDVYEFSQIDPNLPYGLIQNFTSAEEAISFAIINYHCYGDKFINAGLIQDEYELYLSRKKDTYDR